MENCLALTVTNTGTPFRKNNLKKRQNGEGTVRQCLGYYGALQSKAEAYFLIKFTVTKKDSDTTQNS